MAGIVRWLWRLAILGAMGITAGCAGSEPLSAARMNMQTPPPAPDAVWIEGAWVWQGRDAGYIWVPGHWQVPGGRR